jgi:double-stranded uracil-DNA glycosylase
MRNNGSHPTASKLGNPLRARRERGEALVGENRSADEANSVSLAMPSPVLPDLLQPNLRIVFCGTAAGTISAQRGHYYAHLQNKFWATLHAIGLTSRRLDPSEFRRLADWGIGLTDIAKHVSGKDWQLPSGSLGRDACEDLRQRILANRPGILAFTSLTAGRRYLGRKAAFGEQSETIGATRLWVLPSPSPAAHWNWRENERWWRALVEAARAGV